MNSGSSERLLRFKGVNLTFDSSREREAVCILCQKFKGRLIAELWKTHGYVTVNTPRRLNY